MSLDVLTIWILAIVFFFFYLLIKYKYKAYIFSSFNISLFIYTFNIVLAPVFYMYDDSWKALNVTSASSMTSYLNKVICIDCIGYICFVLTIIVAEFGKYTPTHLFFLAKKMNKRISVVSVDVLFIVFILLWHVICIYYCKGYPLLNGKRTFYLNLSISPVYLFLNECLVAFTLFYFFNLMFQKKNLINATVGVVTVALQGNRSSLIIYILLPALLIYLYQKKGSNIKRIKMLTVKIVLYFLIAMVLGIWIQLIRKGMSTSMDSFFHEIFYGNTFSDIRDGAYVLKGFDINTKSEFVLGKTYLSALISFVPSSISKFRYMWSWGRYTTIGLFGMQNHFGLRGGNAMEAYINFGWLGVLVISCMQGVISGLLEKVFWILFISKDKQFMGIEYIIFMCIEWIRNFFVSSSNAYNFYVLVVLIILLCSITKVVNRVRPNNYSCYER